MIASVVREGEHVRGRCDCGWLGELRDGDVAGYMQAFRDVAAHAATCFTPTVRPDPYSRGFEVTT